MVIPNGPWENSTRFSIRTFFIIVWSFPAQYLRLVEGLNFVI